MDKCKALVIDDEKPARDLIKDCLQRDERIEVIAEAGNGFDALRLIHDLHPDLLFLDIQMPKINGIELLEVLDNPPKVIFTTAYEEYAIKAFELNAVDYLLKPFTIDRLEKAISKALSNLTTLKKEQINNLREKSLENHPEMLERIVIKDGSEINVIGVHDVDYIEAFDDYVFIYTANKKFLKSATMKYFEQHLDGKVFVRIHRSYIVNISNIAKLEPWGNDSHLLILTNGKKLKVSKSGYKALREVLNI